jgi:transcriptional antiterminator NusG
LKDLPAECRAIATGGYDRVFLLFTFHLLHVRAQLARIATPFAGFESPYFQFFTQNSPHTELVSRAVGLVCQQMAEIFFLEVTGTRLKGGKMSSAQSLPMEFSAVGAGPLLETPQWFAIRTRSRHEKMVADQLERQDIESFLPLAKKTHKWSDRQKEVELPLFSGYSFARLILGSPDRVRVLQTHGVAGFVGVRGVGIPVPERQIESLKTLLTNQVAVQDHPALPIGQRVRITGGALDGVEGVLTAHKGERTLVISIEPIQRSLSICVDDYNVDPI